MQTLFVLAFEKSIRRLVDVAEGALEVLAERDRLLAENQSKHPMHTHTSSFTGPDHEHGSGMRPPLRVAEKPG